MIEDDITAVQLHFVDLITRDPWCITREVTPLPENSADIEFNIESALSKLGLVAVVMTPLLTYAGKTDTGALHWRVDNLTVAVSEIPLINRARANSATALSVGLRLAHVFRNSGVPVTITQSELSGVVIAQLVFKTCFTITQTEDPELPVA